MIYELRKKDNNKEIVNTRVVFTCRVDICY